MSDKHTLSVGLDLETIAYPKPMVAWITVVALFVAYIFSFIDRMIIGLLVEPMKADLDLSDTEISLLQGFAFAVFYTFAGIPIGRFIDRSSRTKVIAAGMSLWSVMTMLCGLSVQYWQLFLARIGVGVGEATLSPAAYSIISDSFPPRQLGLAMGVYVLGSAVGAGLAFVVGAAIISLVANADNIVIPLVGDVRMWQVAFLLVGLPGLLLSPLILLLPEPMRRTSSESSGAVATNKEVIQFCSSRLRTLMGIFFGVGFINISVFASVSWLPVFYIRAHGFELVDAGYVAGAALIVGGVIGLLGGGWICDRIGGAPQQRLFVAGAASVVGIVTAALFPLVENATVATALFIVCFIACTAPAGAAVSALQQISPNNMRATLSAGYLFVVSIVGMTLGPTITALIGDVYFPQEDGIRYAIAIVSSLGFIGAAALFFMAATAHKQQWTPA